MIWGRQSRRRRCASVQRILQAERPARTGHRNFRQGMCRYVRPPQAVAALQTGTGRRANAGHGAITCPRATNGRRRSMLGLASKTEPAAAAPRVRSGRPVCLTWPGARAARGTAKTHAEWAFVSGVSVVSPYLKLREDSNGEWEKHGRGVVGDPARALRQVGQTQQLCGFQGETTGVKHR